MRQPRRGQGRMEVGAKMEIPSRPTPRPKISLQPSGQCCANKSWNCRKF